MRRTGDVVELCWEEEGGGGGVEFERAGDGTSANVSGGKLFKSGTK